MQFLLNYPKIPTEKTTKCGELHKTPTLTTYLHDLWLKNERQYLLVYIYCINNV